ncbi:inorganic pyrophosphatase [Nannocystis exedens]|uniref:inorganic diphosphatase n=1 Tax=Nannocystis exedens TaxID=54 RepID=A0A1I2IC41_9BACT|nr:inorganic diphosphatase [Nannocystis exedens]PCC67142.1 Inorganic pyrophosphatase [Nannocystis exedens]SFF39902.1 inorganic pyrophosphatase [Nannocystis exedens]
MARDRFARIPAFVADDVHVVIESPAGSRSKYKWDPALDAFTLHKVLPAGMAFPLEFGFVPGTKGADGDPLDALVLTDEPTFAGCLVRARLLGVMTAEQTAQGEEPVRNDRFLAVSAASRTYERLQGVQDISPRARTELEQFFVHYNELFGRRFRVLGMLGPEAARSLLEAGQK